MIKKVLLLLLSILILLTSCSGELNNMSKGENDVNYFIYPYLKFTLSPDRTYYIASVVEGAKLTTVSVPGYVHTDFGAMPIKEFDGFENINDSVNLKELTLDFNVEKIKEGSLAKAENLSIVKTTGDKDGPKWANLPTLVKSGYHFIGWKAGNTFVYNGMPIDPNNKDAVPVWGKLIHHAEVKASCTTNGSIEYWQCDDCNKIFTDSYAQNSVNDVSVPAVGHLYPFVHKVAVAPTCQTEGNKEYWRCDRCMETFADAEGRIPLPDYMLDKVDHQHDGEMHFSETVHFHKCIWCGTALDEEEHYFPKWEIDISATEHTKGLQHADCSYCDYTKTVEIPEHDHFDYEPAAKVKVDATCLAGAYYLEKCGNPKCGEELKIFIENEPALGHRGTVYGYKDSSCTETGTLAHIWCDVCNAPYENRWSKDKMETIVVPLKAHEYNFSWTIGEDTHYHLCNICKKARSDESAHVYKQVVDPTYLKYSSNCQHANRYIESCECGKEGTEIFESGAVGDHSFTIYEAIDEEYHWLLCQWCGTADEGLKEQHSFVAADNGKKCSKCGYIVPFSEGSFTPILVDKSPKGHIELISEEKGVFTFRFFDDKTEHPVTAISWTTDGIAESSSDDETFVFTAPYKQTYFVRCVFRNDYGVGSQSMQITGGNRT